MHKLLRTLSILSIMLCIMLASPVVAQELTPEDTPDVTAVATSAPDPVATVAPGDPVDTGDPGGVVIVQPEVPRILEVAIIGLIVTVVAMGFILGTSAPKWILQIMYSAAGNAALATPSPDDDKFLEDLLKTRGYEKHVEDSGIVVYRPSPPEPQT